MLSFDAGFSPNSLISFSKIDRNVLLTPLIVLDLGVRHGKMAAMRTDLCRSY